MLQFNFCSSGYCHRLVEVLAKHCKLVLWAAFSKVCTKPAICILQGFIFIKGFSGQITLGNTEVNTVNSVIHCRTVQRFDQGILFFSRTISQVSCRWNTLWEMPGLEETAPLALESLASYLTSLNVNFSNLNLWVLLALVVVWRIIERYIRTFSLKLGTSHSSLWWLLVLCRLPVAFSWIYFTVLYWTYQKVRGEMIK